MSFFSKRKKSISKMTLTWRCRNNWLILRCRRKRRLYRHKKLLRPQKTTVRQDPRQVERESIPWLPDAAQADPTKAGASTTKAETGKVGRIGITGIIHIDYVGSNYNA